MCKGKEYDTSYNTNSRDDIRINEISDKAQGHPDGNIFCINLCPVKMPY